MVDDVVEGVGFGGVGGSVEWDVFGGEGICGGGVVVVSFVVDVVFGLSRFYGGRRRWRRRSIVVVVVGGGEDGVMGEGWWMMVERVLSREVEGEERGIGERVWCYVWEREGWRSERWVVFVVVW